jgi:hypothetical protein
MTDEIYVEMAATTGRTAEVSLEEHLTFERLLADLSALFANASGDQLEEEIESGLKQLLEFLDFDRSNFGEFTADGRATIYVRWPLTEWSDIRPDQCRRSRVGISAGSARKKS